VAAAGEGRIGHDRIDKDRIRSGRTPSGWSFTSFTERQSVRQVHVWLRDEGIALPVAWPQRRRGQQRLEAAALQHGSTTS